MGETWQGEQGNRMTEPFTPLDRPTLVAQLRALGIEGGEVLLVHTSFRAIRPITGGPDGLIDALLEALGPTGTLVMPSWPASSDDPFDPSRTPVAPDLGTVAEHFRRRPETARSPHPHAFAACGPAAHEILADPLPIPPHCHESPVGRVFDLDGRVLLLGVDHDANTTIHLAEDLAGVPYGIPHSATLFDESGAAHRFEFIEPDHCCRRFTHVGDWLGRAGLESEGPAGRGAAGRTGRGSVGSAGLESVAPVGHGVGRLSRSRDIVEVVTGHLADNPLHFLHPPDAGCAECDEARAHIP